MFKDPNSRVREAICWVMSKVCEHHPGIFMDPLSANEIIIRIKDGLDDKPRISNHCCSALEKLAESYSYM
jgi:hypothetical protein